MNLVRAPGNGYEEGLDAGKGVAGTWKPSSTSCLENWIKAVREVFLARYWKEMFFYFCGGGSLAADPCSEFWFPHTPNGPLLGKGWDDVMIWYTDHPFPAPPAPPGEPPVQEIPPRTKAAVFAAAAQSTSWY